MRTIVLNLEGAVERREYMIQILSKEKMDFEFFRSFSPADLDPVLIRENSSDIFSKEGVATFETHRRAIGMAGEFNEFTLILEDDATPRKDNVRVEIERLLGKTQDFDMMFLGYVPKAYRDNTRVICEDFMKLKKFFGFHSYVINPRSVNKILGLLGDPNRHVDGWVSQLIREGRLNALFTRDRLFGQNLSRFRTQIPKKRDMLNLTLYDARRC
jgi:hypothetical protein